jgi:DNA-directed DNA polymerase III PolC
MLSILHAWTGYSLCRGAAGPQKLVARAAAAGYAGVALTDVNGLYGVTIFYPLARQAGLNPIIGAELSDGRSSVVALVADRVGYENLCQAITREIANCASTPLSTLSPSKGRLPIANCEEAHPSSICNLQSAICNPDASLAGLQLVTEDADLAASLLAGGMPREQVWLELDPASQPRSLVARLTAAAEALGIELVATGRTLMVEAEDRDVARVLTAIRLGKTVESIEEQDLPPAGAVLRSPSALERQLAEWPRALENNRRLAEQCRYALLPQRPVFPDYNCPPGVPAREHLRRLCEQGARWRYGRISPAVRGRLEKELRLIEAKGFSEYFLVVRDIVLYARGRNAPTAGRGSGASSLVAYVLGITNVCPLAFEIPFERFLHEGREDFPDLDLDFCWRIRDDVINYAFGRWGADHVAMVCTHNTFQPRSAFRETAKAYGLSDDQISRLLKRGDEAGHHAGDIARLAERLVGLPHLLSVHPGGIVIGRKPIDHYVPLEMAAKGVRITQYDKDGVEAIGLVKLDLLGNRSISTIAEACRVVNVSAENGNSPISVDTMPPDDPATFALLRDADTIGCNQLESPAMRHLLRAMAPTRQQDIMKALALIRPGAASIGMKDAFIRRQRGLEKTPPSDPRIDPILGQTHGVMLYEDDVMLVAAALLGDTLSQADRFRKAVQKCRDDAQRLALSREFLSRCAANGVDARIAADLWVQMAKFNAYSFCKAHAASYARLAYAVAYLKAHWPREFWTAALNNNQSMYHVRVYAEQAKRAGIRFLLPDVNRSGAEFVLEADGIRVGLSRIAGLGPVSVEAIRAARRGRPFASLSDFLDRTHLGLEETRAIILCGGGDSLGESRAALMLELRLWRPARAAHAGPQPALLAAAPAVAAVAEDYSPQRKIRDERAILGISVGEHPLAEWRSRLVDLCPTIDADSRDLPGRIGRRVQLAGLLEAARTVTGAAGRQVSFLTFDDEYGLFEVTALADRCRHVGRPNDGQPALIRGHIQEQHGTVGVEAEEVEWPGSQ